MGGGDTVVTANRTRVPHPGGHATWGRSERCATQRGMPIRDAPSGAPHRWPRWAPRNEPYAIDELDEWFVTRMHLWIRGSTCCQVAGSVAEGVAPCVTRSTFRWRSGRGLRVRNPSGERRQATRGPAAHGPFRLPRDPGPGRRPVPDLRSRVRSRPPLTRSPSPTA